jgi:predicted LPLAT superfamily acyltransferase
MPQWEGKSKGNKTGYRIFVFICRKLGAYPAYFILLFVAFYYFLFSYSSSKHIYRYFHDRIGYGRVKSIVKIYHNYFLLGQTLLDKVIVMAGIGNKFTYEFDGEENLRAIVAKGRGGILISAHVGNWEAAGHLLKRLNTKVNVVMFDGEHQQIKNYLNEVTGGRNFNVIVVRDNISHVYAIGEALQKNELICLHADRFVGSTKTITQKFLGADARFPVGPFALASTFKVPVSFVFAFKESLSHYHFYGSRLFEYNNSTSRQEYTGELILNFIKEVEKGVKKYPEQWFNYYNFWKN